MDVSSNVPTGQLIQFGGHLDDNPGDLNLYFDGVLQNMKNTAKCPAAAERQIVRR